MRERWEVGEGAVGERWEVGEGGEQLSEDLLLFT